MNTLSYYTPQSLKEAWDIKKRSPQSCFIAGGTDLLVKIKDRITQPSCLISLRSIPELKGISHTQGLSLGAMATISEIYTHPFVQQLFPVLIEAAKSLGSKQIRNVATIGGNICNSSPCANMAPPLLVLDANVEIKSQKGERIIPLHDFFIGPGANVLKPGEIVTAFHVPIPTKTSKALFYKKGRVTMDIAVASFALLIEIKEDVCTKARFAAGSVAPFPIRLFEVEKQVEGSRLAHQSIKHIQQAVVESVTPISDIRSTGEYRRIIISLYVKRAIEKILEWNQQ